MILVHGGKLQDDASGTDMMDVRKDPALCGDMSDPYADGNGSKILPMFDPYADGKPKIWPHVRSKQGAEMAGRQ
jgi:hypothetical protein